MKGYYCVLMDFYRSSEKEALEHFQSSDKGLTSAQAQERLKIYGPNRLKEPERVHPLVIFLSQFKSPLVWILFGAMVISLLVKEYVDFYVIGIIVVLNALLGFFQEYRAEAAIEALMKLISLKATVLRDAKQVIVDATEVVPGDILIINTGDKVSADCRLLEAFNLGAQEAVLTGESVPEKKEVCVIAKEVGVADRKNMIFSGTIITSGHARALVVATGMQTEIGKIATLIQETAPEATPLQKTLAKISARIGLLVICIAFIVLGVGLIRLEESFTAILLTAVSLAVAAIPEGLPAVVTVGLSMGVQRLAKKNALMRHLPSVETLGSCSVICTDKTGTLTKNEMTVRQLLVNRKVVSISGVGYAPQGEFSDDSKKFELLLRIGALNNNASLKKEGEAWQIVGDPTEGALLVSAKKAGLDDEALHDEFARLEEVEFTSERKRMTTVHKAGKGRVAYMKGAPEVVLNLCDRILVNGKVERLVKKEKDAILAKNVEFAKSALRVLGFAYKDLSAGDKGEKKYESGMVFVGLQAMMDPPRPDAKDAVEKCKTAGIKVVMITGDNIITAQSVAREIGIEGKAVGGDELRAMTDLEKQVEEISIYARVNPEDKLHIVAALKANGHIVAMTGDGVNDAPAIKKADIGISMGITGTDVAKEASVMVLADDNFATIVRAVEEGRRVFENIKKYLAYLLASNVGEVSIILTALLVGLPLPLLALQILWINLVTDGFPALALGIDPAEPNVMQVPPRKPGESVFKGLGKHLVVRPILLTIGVLGLFYYFLDDLSKAQTIAFTTVVFFESLLALSCHSLHKPIVMVRPFSNLWLYFAIASSMGLQLAVLYVPLLQEVFSTVALSLGELGLILGVSFAGFLYMEIHKFFAGD